MDIPQSLEALGTLLVLVAVWRIGAMDIRGQYLMLAAQFVWFGFAWAMGLAGLAAQSAALAVLTARAVVLWRRKDEHAVDSSMSSVVVERGATRTVLLVGRLAFKFPSAGSWRRFLRGLLANMQERQFWTGYQAEPERLLHMAPVLWSLPLGLLVVMPRCETLTHDEHLDLSLSGWMDQFERIPVEIGKPDSFGWYDPGERKIPRVVAVDYGG